MRTLGVRDALPTAHTIPGTEQVLSKHMLTIRTHSNKGISFVLTTNTFVSWALLVPEPAHHPEKDALYTSDALYMSVGPKRPGEITSPPFWKGLMSPLAESLVLF